VFKFFKKSKKEPTGQEILELIIQSKKDIIEVLRMENRTLKEENARLKSSLKNDSICNSSNSLRLSNPSRKVRGKSDDFHHSPTNPFNHYSTESSSNSDCSSSSSSSGSAYSHCD
jgi:FtsZ-binding cell division protein ZapB